MRYLLKERNRGALFALVGGLLAAILGCILLLIGKGGGLALIILGVCGIMVAGVADQWKLFHFKGLGVDVETGFYEKEHGVEFVAAAVKAPDTTLAAVIPLLRQDAASSVLELPAHLGGRRLRDPELSWVRQELNVTVFAIQRPADGQAWCGGGRISEMVLPATTKLAVVGDKSDIGVVRERLTTGR